MNTFFLFAFWSAILLVVGNHSLLATVRTTKIPAEARLSEESDTILDEKSFERLEWRGSHSLAGRVEFSLHDPVTKQSFWIFPGHLSEGLVVESFDPQKNALTLRLGESIRVLTLAGGGGKDLPSAGLNTPARDTDATIKSGVDMTTGARGTMEGAPTVVLVPIPKENVAAHSDEGMDEAQTVTVTPVDENP